jgi:hypothetical protein
MINIGEGNLYNIETQTKGDKDASKSGLQGWKNEVRKQALEKLRSQNLPNIDEIMQKIFGDTLD